MPKSRVNGFLTLQIGFKFWWVKYSLFHHMKIKELRHQFILSFSSAFFSIWARLRIGLYFGMSEIEEKGLKIVTDALCNKFMPCQGV